MKAKVENGVATGIFTFRKGGANFSLGVANDKELDYIRKNALPDKKKAPTGTKRDRLSEIS